MRWFLVPGVLLLSLGCRPPREKIEKEVPAMKLTSTAFKEGETIPKKYTGEGPDVSPPLQWDGAPQGTASLALICDDPDAPAGIWVHWLIFNIPGDKTQLPENLDKTATLSDGSRQGENSWKNSIGYRGPMPPPGKPHRYFFKLYALDQKLDLPEGKTTKKDLEKAMAGHVLAEGKLMGKYAR